MRSCTDERSFARSDTEKGARRRLHGTTDSWRSFERVLPHLPDSVHAFALTQRGHGDANRPVGGYRPQEFAADVAAFMDALDIKQAVVAGSSMGSSIASTSCWTSLSAPLGSC